MEFLADPVRTDQPGHRHYRSIELLADCVACVRGADGGHRDRLFHYDPRARGSDHGAHGVRRLERRERPERSVPLILDGCGNSERSPHQAAAIDGRQLFEGRPGQLGHSGRQL